MCCATCDCEHFSISHSFILNTHSLSVCLSLSSFPVLPRAPCARWDSIISVFAILCFVLIIPLHDNCTPISLTLLSFSSRSPYFADILSVYGWVCMSRIEILRVNKYCLIRISYIISDSDRDIYIYVYTLKGS